jgi:hypothetical protein
MFDIRYCIFTYTIFSCNLCNFYNFGRAGGNRTHVACISDRCITFLLPLGKSTSNYLYQLSNEFTLVGRGGICTTTVFRRRFYRALGSLVPSRPMIADDRRPTADHRRGTETGDKRQETGDEHLITPSPRRRRRARPTGLLVPLAGAAPTPDVWKTPALLLRYSGMMNPAHPGGDGGLALLVWVSPAHPFILSGIGPAGRS